MFPSKAFFRHGLLLAGSPCRFYRSRSANPGVGRRLKIFKQENPDLSRTKLTEKDFDESEVDVMDGDLLKEYEREYQKVSKRIAFQRVERDYFEKSTSPNFLLWAEKEQIRQLHHSEPEKWSYEALSQSFPATSDVIKKIVEAQWKLKEHRAIIKHDKKVIANWKALAKKKIELPPRTAEHLSKFTTRDHSLLLRESKDLVKFQEQQTSTNGKLVPTKSTQFINIVRKQQKSDSASADKDDSNYESSGDGSKCMPSYPSETYVIRGRISKFIRTEQYTLSEMRESGVLSKSTKDTSGIPDPGKELDSELPKSSSSIQSKGIINPSKTDSFSIPRYADASKVPNDEPLAEIPMRITIPKEKWKKGAVYKVNNCFYADDGEFLYKI